MSLARPTAPRRGEEEPGTNDATDDATGTDKDTSVASRGARVVPVPPPLYYAAAFAVGLLLHSRSGTPLALGGRPATVVLGAGLLAAGVGLATAGVVTVVRHHTTIVPHAPVSTLVRTGPYRWTRNPMYTGLAIGYLGAAGVADTWWPILTMPAALLAIRWLVIAPEERYLTSLYGPDYADYKAHVRRWL